MVEKEKQIKSFSIDWFYFSYLTPLHQRAAMQYVYIYKQIALGHLKKKHWHDYFAYRIKNNF